jgi:hypothetical protein
MFRLFEKILALLVVAPPLYIGLRWLRWYLRNRQEEKLETAADS